MLGYAVISRFMTTRREEPVGLGGISALPAIAVFPFTVRGSDENQDLHEGMVDLLSMKLNGAGAIRSIDPRVVLSAVKREVEGSLDLTQASEIADRFGAAFYMMGDVFGVGEQLVINASLYEPERGTEAVVHASVEGRSEQILGLVDSLAIHLVRDRLGDLIEAPIRLEHLTTQSYTALKAFLEGEREFRAGRPFMPGGQKSVAAYQRAIQADSTFALAWLRLANVTMWWGAGFGLIERAIENAVRHGARMSARDRLFAQAYCTQWSTVDLCNPHKLFPDESRGSSGQAAPQSEIEEAERLYRIILDSWPDDFEALMGLGHVQLYFNWRRGRSIAEARETYERARELDPDSWRVLWRLAWIASVERRYEEHERLQGIIYPDGAPLISTRVSTPYGLGREDEKRSIYEELKSATGNDLFLSGRSLAQNTEDFVGAQEVARLMTRPERADEVRGLGHVLLAHQEAAWGRRIAAREEILKAEKLCPTYTLEHKALLASMPFLEVPETDLTAFRQDLTAWDATAVTPDASPLWWFRVHDDLHPILRTYLLGLLSARLGETDDVLQRASELEGMFDIPESPRDSTWIQDLAHGLRAQAAMAEGRLEDALAHFEKARFKVLQAQILYSSFYFQTLERYLRAEVLFKLGRYEEALGWYSNFGWCWGYEFVYQAPADLRRAQIYERLGQPQEAAEHYTKFIGRWADCDEDLRPVVDEARKRLSALTADER
jgi:tetratricopeptide (TPR) repeat protein